MVSFMLLLNILKILKISFWTFCRKNCISLSLWALFFLNPCKGFTIALCKQLRVVKSSLNSDLYFMFKISGTALLETTVSYKSPSSLFLENRKTPSPASLETSETALICISSIVNEAIKTISYFTFF